MDGNRKSTSNVPVTPPNTKKSRSRTRGTESNMNVIPETPEQQSPPTPKRRINFNESSMDKFVSQTITYIFNILAKSNNLRTKKHHHHNNNDHYNLKQYMCVRLITQ